MSWLCLIDQYPSYILLSLPIAKLLNYSYIGVASFYFITFYGRSLSDIWMAHMVVSMLFRTTNLNFDPDKMNLLETSRPYGLSHFSKDVAAIQDYIILYPKW